MNILIKLINDVKALCNTVITAVNAIKAKTDTITASVITQAQANNLDATISSRQANAGLTTTHASRIDTSISSRASQASVDAIKSGRPTFGKVRYFSYAFYNNMPLTTIFSYSGGPGKVLFIKNVEWNGALIFIIDGSPIAGASDYWQYGIYGSDGYTLNFEFTQSIQIQRSITTNASGKIEGIVITEK